jgi:hypothetical protein
MIVGIRRIESRKQRRNASSIARVTFYPDISLLALDTAFPCHPKSSTKFRRTPLG